MLKPHKKIYKDACILGHSCWHKVCFKRHYTPILCPHMAGWMYFIDCYHMEKREKEDWKEIEHQVTAEYWGLDDPKWTR